MALPRRSQRTRSGHHSCDRIENFRAREIRRPVISAGDQHAPIQHGGRRVAHAPRRQRRPTAHAARNRIVNIRGIQRCASIRTARDEYAAVGQLRHGVIRARRRQCARKRKCQGRRGRIENLYRGTGYAGSVSPGNQHPPILQHGGSRVRTRLYHCRRESCPRIRDRIVNLRSIDGSTN